ncbi:MAG: UDP-N-acetylmuramoyl-L-alanyl-D-glutamate--2,6-diaminopimelate ligase [Desulfobulbaceae bacterium]|nr:MAG: UDP-N-acetylmuramoyl-L-alanyl-D-glutamate--2,6-diaminopimelate ligase [Desulfobulbaceae bacterium]
MNVTALFKAAKVDYSVDSGRNLDDLTVTAVTADSRRAGEDSLFVALMGTKVDGREYIADARTRGCRVVLTGRRNNLPLRAGGTTAPGTTITTTAAVDTAAAVDQKRPAITPDGHEILYLTTDNPRAAFGRLCAALRGFPAREMIMIGITGTNGKTTSAYLLEELIRFNGGEPGVIGTINYRYRDQVVPAPHTTPEPESLQQLLREMANAGVTHVIMEVSSHALDQGRVAGILFDVALFTNLSREHLDYHGNMQSYFTCKQRLFSHHLKPQGAAVVVVGRKQEDIDNGNRTGNGHGHGYESGNGNGNEGERRNGNENWSQRLIAVLQPLATPADESGRGKAALRLFRCGGDRGELQVLTSRSSLAGIEAHLTGVAGQWTLRSTMVGNFNLDNLLGVAGVGLALGLNVEQISAGLANAGAVPGRLERFTSHHGVEVFVDYAHTPDALAQVLRTLRRLAPRRLITIFGCGGDRDRGKRPLMGKIAASLADIVILTSDNPRSEQSSAIIAAIERGLLSVGSQRCRLECLLGAANMFKGYDLVVSRRQAIRDTLLRTRPGDVVLICGKGHENTQTVGGVSSFFDDRQEVIREQLAILA